MEGMQQRGWFKEVSLICITNIILILLIFIHILILLLFCLTVDGEGSEDGGDGGMDCDQGEGGDEGE